MRGADGYYTYAGRSDDMLKVAGQYVSPFEVEAALMRHDAVLEAAVVGKLEDGLTRTLAYVVLKSGQSGDEALAGALKAFVKDHLAPHKYPREIRFIERAAEDRHRQDPALQAARSRRAMTAVQCAHVAVAGRALDLEYAWIGAAPDAPVIVFLHEGLGSLAMWKDYPQRLCEALGMRGLVFSRPGLRRLHAARGRRAVAGRLHAAAGARRVAGAARCAWRRRAPWLFGHSDGGSIALLYAAAFPDRVAGVVAVAPHLFVEDVSVRNIEAAKVAYETGDLRARLARYHADPDSAFYGWNDIWLDPAFRTWNIEDRAGHDPVSRARGARRGRRIRNDGADRPPRRARAAGDAREARCVRPFAASRPAGAADGGGRRLRAPRPFIGG